ncbi:Hint domain-containing protein [Acinetobacter sp. YH1901134]|uniref:Hint domain-containing protein n=1 Tax=Acinetobacter sp. YH1901134 TaxID=2601199 RepID=UPI0015D12607|nr:Hint domain-containing protein [Acinetobacter sp. YH1901134]
MDSYLNSEAGFPAGTRINTDKGLISIQDINIGDLVLCKPQNEQGKLCYKPILRMVSYENKGLWKLHYFEIKANTDISKLHKGKLSGVSVTANYLFRVKDSGWTRADELQKGQIIETMNPDVVALVFMVNPLRKTSMPNIAGGYHVCNVFDAERKGFDIKDVDYFDLFEYDKTGLCGIPDQNAPSPLKMNGQNVYVLEETFRQKVYNFELADCDTYFIFNDGLWVLNPNCTKANS